MFDSSTILVGLEIGTSKVCAVVGEQSSNGTLSIIGVGQARSRGVRKGEIVDPNVAGEDIRNAIVDAEQAADVEIRSVYLAVTGAHISGFNNRGVHPVVSADREIVREDVLDVVKNAKAINLPAENHIVHVIRQHFHVDNQESIRNPQGMFGARLEVDVHVVHGAFNRLQNPIRAVRSLQLEVEDIVFSGLSAPIAVLSNEQKEMGALVIDLGGGTTEFTVYADGIIKHTGVFAVGGDHVTNDLAYGLKVPLSVAERLKIEHGAAVVDKAAKGRTVSCDYDRRYIEKTVNLEHLQTIMSMRLTETFELVGDELNKAQLLPYLRGGVFLSGGGSRVPEIQRLAEHTLGLPVSLGRTNSISGLKSALDQPEFATALGLVKYGAFRRQGRGKQGGLRQKVSSLFRRG